MLAHLRAVNGNGQICAATDRLPLASTAPTCVPYTQRLLGGLLMLALFVFFPIVRHADLFVEPASQVDLPTARRTEWHGPTLVRIKELIAGWATYNGHWKVCENLTAEDAEQRRGSM